MPLPRTLFSLLSACVLLCLCVLPALGAGPATSLACLEQCAAKCRDASGGETDRAVCLGSCLDGCSVSCGMVDEPCARECMNSASAAAWADSRNLAAACAGNCPAAYNCPPRDMAPAAKGRPWKKIVRAKQKGMDETFVAQDRSFRVAVPWDWDLLEEGGLDAGGDYELTASAPGAEFLQYVSVTVRHVSDPSRTAERFLAELESRHPAAPGTQAVRGAARLDGREALSLETRSVRTLATFPDQVPNWVRAVALPLPAGFVVVVADVPLAVKQKYAAQVERLFQSFRLLAPVQAAAQEVSPEEYAVYAAFLASKGVVEKGRPAKPGMPNDAQPPYLDDAARSRSVYAVTRSGLALGRKVLDTLVSVCGPLDPSLAADYSAKREQHWLLTDRFPAPGVKVRAEKKAKAAPATMERLRPPSGEDMLWGPTLSFSRVGFDAGGNTALFHVANLETSPGTSYLVLMVRREGAWKLSCALMDEMRIY